MLTMAPRTLRKEGEACFEKRKEPVRWVEIKRFESSIFKASIRPCSG